MNFPEEAGAGAPSFVTQLLKEAFNLDKDVIVDTNNNQ